MNAPLKDEFMKEFDRLAPEERARLARDLQAKAKTGVPGASLLRFSGCIPPDDIKRIRDAIEEDFERVHEEP